MRGGGAVRAQHELGLSDEAGVMLDEERALAEAQAGRHIKAREIAEAVVRAQPDSFAGHHVLGFVHHYGEANFARALYHQNRALHLFVQQHGEVPTPPAPWRWHARILREMVWTHGDLEHYEEQLRWMARYSELYEPDFVAERAWPFIEAAPLRRGARGGRARTRHGGPAAERDRAQRPLRGRVRGGRRSGQLRGVPRGHGCCTAAIPRGRARSTSRTSPRPRAPSSGSTRPSAWILLATRAQVSWYGNPWLELTELYVRQARFVEALEALREVPGYRERRPPHVRDADRNEHQRALAQFFLLIGQADDAARMSEKALHAPDRRAHTSRDPAQGPRHRRAAAPRVAAPARGAAGRGGHRRAALRAPLVLGARAERSRRRLDERARGRAQPRGRGPAGRHLPDRHAPERGHAALAARRARRRARRGRGARGGASRARRGRPRGIGRLLRRVRGGGRAERRRPRARA
ncbi:MAG: hypothetical protein M5U28_52675 [Sandaracinaceae bacterium]|nr:hypothetical protein [Sandaracinaceae bacterium]